MANKKTPFISEATFSLPLSSLQPTPPYYNLTRVSVPIVMFTGGNDWIATPTSVGDLLPQIQHVVTFHKHIPHYAHLDFLWGMDVTTEVYDIIVNNMNNEMHF